MSVPLPPTPENLSLAQAVSRRMNADDMLTKARAGFWRWLGAGAICFCLGAAIGLGLYAYSRSATVQVTGEMMTEAVTAALEKVKLQVETTGTLDASGTVALRPGQTVGIERGATVGIDPNASVRVTGEIKVAQPAPQRAATPERSSRVLTNYTVFKTVKMGKGEVITAWMFASNQQAEPTRQLCDYREYLTTGTQGMFTLGLNREFTASDPPQGLDVRAAFANCVWF